MLRRVGIILGVVAVVTPIGGSDAGGAAMARYVDRLNVPAVHFTTQWWLSPEQILVISLCLSALCVLAGVQRCRASAG